MCSLVLQIILYFFASFRKRNTPFAEVMRGIIWVAYLAADVTATYSLVLISKNIIGHPEGNIMDRTYEDTYHDLMAFWAPFPLLNLGGQDSITAYALEDNELWSRHFIYLGARLFACCYIFWHSLPNNSLKFHTILIAVAGTIKYLERTMAVYLASNHGFKSSILAEYDPKMALLE